MIFKAFSVSTHQRTNRIQVEAKPFLTSKLVVITSFDRDSETKEVVEEDQWLVMGDNGAWDDEGFLTLGGFQGDSLTLSSGEVVGSAGLEERVRMELACVEHCILVGEGREGLGVILSMHTELEEGGLPSTRYIV